MAGESTPSPSGTQAPARCCSLHFSHLPAHLYYCFCPGHLRGPLFCFVCRLAPGCLRWQIPHDPGAASLKRPGSRTSPRPFPLAARCPCLSSPLLCSFHYFVFLSVTDSILAESAYQRKKKKNCCSKGLGSRNATHALPGPFALSSPAKDAATRFPHTYSPKAPIRHLVLPYSAPLGPG